MPKVSVIMPTFNRQSFLKDAIESVLLQNFEDFEIIITDNASTDNTEEVVKAFRSAKIVYFRNEKNIGVVNNYNKSLELATGEYIYVFSDDDIMLQGNISSKVEVLDTHPNVGLVHSNIRMIDEAGQVTLDNHWAGAYYDSWYQNHSLSALFNGKEYFKILYGHWNIISMPSVMIRRSVLDTVGVFNTNTHYFCDWDLWLRICLSSDVFYLNEKLLGYRIHASNTISEINSNIKKNELVSIKKMLFEKHPIALQSIGLLEKDILDGVALQTAKYPLVIEDRPVSEMPSILSRIKNRFIRLVS